MTAVAAAAAHHHHRGHGQSAHPTHPTLANFARPTPKANLGLSKHQLTNVCTRPLLRGTSTPKTDLGLLKTPTWTRGGRSIRSSGGPRRGRARG